ncbi:MAG: dTMP kinase [Planctomycetes bacterium]|nr:dTMP kinase [Planctomycetota bacterium]
MAETNNAKPPAQTQGRYIILEGIDGTGKSSVTKLLAEALRSQGREVVLTSEPTDRPCGKLIRERLADRSIKMTAHEWLGLFVADRRIHIDEVVKPALARGADIIQDRSMYSTLVYQGEMGIPEAEILARHKGWHPTPDLLVILDIAPRFGLARTRKRSLGIAQRWVKQKDQGYIFKDGDGPQTTEKLKFLQALRRRYKRIKGDNVLHVDVKEKRPEQVRDEIMERLG